MGMWRDIAGDELNFARGEPFRRGSAIGETTGGPQRIDLINSAAIRGKEGLKKERRKGSQ